MQKQIISASKILQARYRGVKGTAILMHRSMNKLNFSFATGLSLILLPILFDTALFLKMDFIIHLWKTMFDFWIAKLHLGGLTGVTVTKILGKTFYIPFPNPPVALPTLSGIRINILIALILFIISCFIRKTYLPLIYIFRAGIILQLSASIYFFIRPGYVPYGMWYFIPGMMVTGIYMLFLIPIFFALIYYIFDFPFWHKFIATLLTILYFIIFLPMQYMLHAYIISAGTLLFMPVLYLLFGVLLDTLLLISCYSWIMTWKGKDIPYIFIRNS